MVIAAEGPADVKFVSPLYDAVIWLLPRASWFTFALITAISHWVVIPAQPPMGVALPSTVLLVVSVNVTVPYIENTGTMGELTDAVRMAMPLKIVETFELTETLVVAGEMVKSTVGDVLEL